MQYNTILLDVDDTLLDFPACERAAFNRTMQAVGVVPSDELAAAYSVINTALWKQFERGEISRKAIFTTRYHRLATQSGLSFPADMAAQLYPTFLSQQAIPLPGMREALHYLASRYRLYIATNATISVQQPRLRSSGISAFVQDCFFSEQAGVQKPDEAFFHYCFARIPDFSPTATLMLGDSLTSDIRGASNAGIDACWYNRTNAPRPAGLPIALEIHALSEFPQVL